MTASDWGFLLDENIDRQTAIQLQEHDHRADLVVDVLTPGADDIGDILPYARAEDLIIVTKDVSDFARLHPEEHEGLVLVFNDRLSGFQLAAGILGIIEAYGSRNAMRHREIVDQWL